MHEKKSEFSDKKRANAGDIILFERKSNRYEGKVFLVRANSVLVEISSKDAKALGYEMPNTVVQHGKYSLV
ncbi:DUF2187 family protein [Bacillus sp. DTU_2020_1000418_1_SI_GHA_SEK_038]|uniref:DUF2187 family protein n=1 Tax=Bacillus sp. DTU_2020_1000418_1_SI_GHA_SEK_038 TaxID=3077585 RepID=UPI0028EA2B9D|nr:DUF2187 family protein [Bacillus sp. DTU_2020_1000418_1_SI_GHA_SEK_038]WNS75062.1 DUF2187 family protein [Bacillus sp. DTU_2020_1000418_1_SI_GHA_SEK_038]